jgi:hypothetical protein
VARYGDLSHYFEGHICLQPAGALDEFFQCFTFDKLHRIKVVAAGFAQMKHRGHIGMTDAARRPGFPDKTVPGWVIADESSVNDLQGCWALQVDIKGFVGDSYRAVSELDRYSLFVLQNLVVLKAKLGRKIRTWITLGFESALQGTNRT